MSTIAEIYSRFAEVEAAGNSATYVDWASSIARDDEVVALISGLPGNKVQPNLVFAAARKLGAPVGPYASFRDWLIAQWESVVGVVLSHATQTNESGRCAVLLPVLSRLGGPLSLVEVGASAGLCLYPDRYSYLYNVEGRSVPLWPDGGRDGVDMLCDIDSAGLPGSLPSVAWRAGIDLNPMDVEDDEQMSWLETLVWPEQEARRERLRAAIRIARRERAELIEGDLVDRLPDLVQRAPAGSRVVVFHSAVMIYLAPERREEFVKLVESMPEVTWISNEGPGVFPAIAAQVTRPIGARMILSVDGSPVALVGAHGQSYESLDSATTPA
ncbi:DUF2332 domain-containing protein [Schumannella luteola]